MISSRLPFIRTLFAGSLLLAPFGALTSANADTVTYSSASAFEAAAGENSIYSFAAPAVGPFQEVNSSAYTDGPLTFGAYRLFLANDGEYGAGQTYLVGRAPDLVDTSTETVSLSGATALSFTLGTFVAGNSVSVSINGSPAAVFDSPGAAPATGFLGVTSTTPITSVVFSYTNELDIVGFQVGNVNVVPEPGTWALMIVGLSALIAMRCQTRKRSEL